MVRYKQWHDLLRYRECYNHRKWESKYGGIDNEKKLYRRPESYGTHRWTLEVMEQQFMTIIIGIKITCCDSKYVEENYLQPQETYIYIKMVKYLFIIFESSNWVLPNDLIVIVIYSNNYWYKNGISLVIYWC